MPVHRVLVTALSFSRYNPEPKEMLEREGFELKWNTKGRPLSAGELIEEALSWGGVQALIVGVDPVTREVIFSLPELKVIAKHGVGVDNIDLEAARERGVLVTYAPGSNHDAVADLVFGLLLAVIRQIPRADATTKQGKWERIVGVELWGKTLGLIGTGRIGIAVAHRARGFAMRILAYDPRPNPEAAAKLGIEYVELEEVLRQSDFVSLHAPLVDSTYRLINRETLSLMKPTAVLINTARGELVDEEALYQALKTGQIAGAGLDVYRREPPGNGHPLLTLPNVVTTPHIGAYTREANLRMGMAVAEGLIKVFRGERPENLVA